ncbi:MAG: DNA polymerase I [Phycisphaerales bacterium]
MPTLYLIDGYAQFFRAYHAIRTPMSSPVTKEPTNMTFGFIGMLLKLMRGEGKIGEGGGRPDFVAVALDISGDKETFRSEIDPEYKANRPPPPPDLFPQVDRCLAMLKAVGIPTVGIEGFEADDAIATVVDCLRRERPDVRIRIVSKDKDLKQLLEPGAVEMYDIHTDGVIDDAKLKEETNLAPAQVVDMLALMGDNVDNVKGVEGIGPKTAAELIAKFGTLPTLMARAAEVPGKRGEALRAAVADGRLSKNITLVKLRRDAPVALDLKAAATSGHDLGALLPILKELGFNRYQDEVRALTGQAPVMVPNEPGRVAEPAAGKTAAKKARVSEGPSLFDAQGTEGPGDGADGSVAGREGNPGYRCIRTQAELKALVTECQKAEMVSIDTETTGLSPLRCKLCGVSISTRAGTGAYIPIRSPEPATHLDERAVLEGLRPLFEDASVRKCGHNLKYDLLVLRAAGVELRGVAFDSMVASYLIDASRSSHGLDALALGLLGHSNIPISELIGSGAHQRTFDTAPLAQATQYAAEDADFALRLRALMDPQLDEMGLRGLFDGVEMPLVGVLADLEYNGILCDPSELDRQRERLTKTIKELREKIDDAAMESIGRTFNPDSPKQLSVALFGKPGDAEPGLGLKPVKKTKTGHSTDVEVLEKLASDVTIRTPIPGLIVDYRQLTKLVSTYLVALREAIHPETKRIHASFNQTVAVTGRLASSDPNLQNIPIRTEVGREIRRAFVAAPGRVFISADYSQIELRLLAHLSRDPALIAAFHEGQDIHTAVAAQINGVAPEQVTKEMRSGAKMVNFGIVYGVTAFGLARRLGIENDAADQIITGYKKRFAGITTFLQECIDQAQRTGFVETILKRRRPISEIESPVPARRAFAERTAINSVVQGSAADLIKLAMVNLARELGKGDLGGVKMLLQIHDELVLEAPEDGAERARVAVVRAMEGAMTLDVPLRADSSIARNWFDGK